MKTKLGSEFASVNKFVVMYFPKSVVFPPPTKEEIRRNRKDFFVDIIIYSLLLFLRILQVTIYGIGLGLLISLL